MNHFTKSILAFVMLAGAFLNAKAQNYTVKGSVLDTAGLPLPGAVVRINWVKDSLGISANTDGSFVFTKVKAKQFTLTAAFIGFDTFTKQYIITQGNSLDISNIKLKPTSNTLDAVVISGVPPVKITEDTVSFNAASFPVREGDAADEILKKLPGIKVDKDGNVTNQGTPVTKIKVNGKDFFGTDVATAIKNLPADIIKNLQFIDDYGDQAKLTGIKTGEPEKVLNLTIQEDKKKGYFARAQGGLGNLDRYNSSFRGNSMKGERQLSFDGTVNNANQRGGGDGITTRNAAGLNYRNEWSPKLSANASYNFDNSKNNTSSTAHTQNFLDSYTRLENSRNDNLNKRFNHDFNGNVEYKPDTMNFFKATPQISYNTNAGSNTGFSAITQNDLVTNRNSNNSNTSSNLFLKVNLFYNHKFAKKGRNFSYWGGGNYSNGDNFNNVSNDYLISEGGVDSTRLQNQLNNQNNNNLGLYSGFSYMEPLWNKTFIELNYNFSRSATSNIRDTRDVVSGEEVFNPDLSNNYNYQFITNKVGVNYRYIGDKLNYTLGVNGQPAVLRGQNLSKDVSTMQKTFNIIPSARMVYKFSNQESFEFNYWGRSNQPGFFQLQPIADNSNLQNVIIGNPNLKPEFVNSINARYKQSDWNKGHMLSAGISYNQTGDKIVTTKVLIPNTVNQVTSYTNTDGFYNLNGDYNYSKPILERKFTIEYSGWGALRNNVAFIDNNKNVAKNTEWRQELGFRVDLENIINLRLEASYSQNKTTYSQSAFVDRQTNRFQYGLEGRNYFFKDLTVGYDFSKQINSGFDNSFVRNPTILRLFMEYKFLKKDMGTLRLDGFDLFNENSGISRDVFDNIIVDRQVNRLGRYFMLSFIFKVRKFGG
ncbi:TonB-dependent receptor [Pedobacter foliorum]|uniref:TonB-dependent receptor n=1 Tax=Pedobacter foliorum TaxID=2739058 RepID=UPI001566ED7B|nr:TonB-dependent receptor [Pedobacter foliorum]NRF41893.1 TonB-dependent receptor [Pedobacter foliorum]